MQKVAALQLLADQPLCNSVSLSQDFAVDGDGAQNGREKRRKGIAPASLYPTDFAPIPGKQAFHSSAYGPRSAYERHGEGGRTLERYQPRELDQRSGQI